MRRRILIAILGTVALSLVLSGAGTYLLLTRQAERATEAGLRAEAEALASLVGVARNAELGAIRQKRIVAGLRVEGISVVVVGPAGVLRGELPSGVDPADLPPDRLQAGETVSGVEDSLVWAASGVATPNGGAIAVVLTRSTDRPAPPVGWFVLGGSVALAVAAAVAWALSGDITRPLGQAHDATARVASGDLSARLPEPSATDRTELADLTRSFNAMAGALEDSRGLQRQFLLSVSHDLRTPLTSIRGYAEAIADGTAPDAASAATIIGTEAQRLTRLVGDLLDLARLDAHSFNLSFATVAVAEVVTDTAEGFRPAAEAIGVTLEVADHATGAPARVDPDRLAQAVANLVENALRHAAGRVRVDTTASPGGATRITVVDDGPGIDPTHVPHVFERLYAPDRRPTRGPAPGGLGGSSGLGLAIVHELVAAMGGRVGAESPALPDGSGARLVIDLPPPADPDAAQAVP